MENSHVAGITPAVLPSRSFTFSARSRSPPLGAPAHWVGERSSAGSGCEKDLVRAALVFVNVCEV